MGSRYGLESGQGSPKDVRVGPHLPRELGVTLISSRLFAGRAAFQRLLDTNQKEHRTLKAIKMNARVVTHTAHALKHYTSCVRHEHRQQYLRGASSPSTGLLALALLNAMCQHTTLFGMGGGSQPGAFPYHYFQFFGTQQQVGSESHNFEAEQAMIATLAVERKRVAMCNVSGCYGHRSSHEQHALLMRRLPFVD